MRKTVMFAAVIGFILVFIFANIIPIRTVSVSKSECEMGDETIKLRILLGQENEFRIQQQRASEQQEMVKEIARIGTPKLQCETGRYTYKLFIL